MLNSFKRFASAFMIVVMIVAMMPFQAFAVFEDESGNESLASADSFDLDFVEECDAEQGKEVFNSEDFVKAII